MRDTASSLLPNALLIGLVSLAAVFSGCTSSAPPGEGPAGTDDAGGQDERGDGEDSGTTRRTTTYWNNGTLGGGVGVKALGRWAEVQATITGSAFVYGDATAAVLEMTNTGTGDLMACVRLAGEPAVCYGAAESERAGSLYVTLDLAPGEQVFDAHADGVSGSQTYSIALTVFYGEGPGPDFTALA